MKKATCIFLVDDNQTTTFIHERLINNLGITEELIIAPNGKIALELLQQRQDEGKGWPELILLDLNMPVMDGIEFYQAFQQFDPEVQAAIKVVVLTSSFAYRDVQRAQETGIRHFINKPLTMEKLKHMWPEQIRESLHE